MIRKLKPVIRMIPLTAALLSGVFSGCWLAYPSVGLLMQNSHSQPLFSSSAVVLPLLAGFAFVLAIRFCSCLKHRAFWLFCLMFLRGAVFGYCYFVFCRMGSNGFCIAGIMISLVVLAAAYSVMPAAISQPD